MLQVPLIERLFAEALQACVDSGSQRPLRAIAQHVRSSAEAELERQALGGPQQEEAVAAEEHGEGEAQPLALAQPDAGQDAAIAEPPPAPATADTPRRSASGSAPAEADSGSLAPPPDDGRYTKPETPFALASTGDVSALQRLEHIPP